MPWLRRTGSGDLAPLHPDMDVEVHAPDVVAPSITDGQVLAEDSINQYFPNVRTSITGASPPCSAGWGRMALMSHVESQPETLSLEDLLENGRWTHDPVHVERDGDAVVVTAGKGSDAWRHTSYGFVHDSEHALLAPIGKSEALEVSFQLDYSEQFDQAGIFFWASADEWIKAGVEAADGAPQVGAVVTHGNSDWSTSPVPEWMGGVVTVRASRAGDAVTIRARVGDEPWRLVRVAHLDPSLDVEAGIFCAAPSREGLRVTFLSHRRGQPDDSLH